MTETLAMHRLLFALPIASVACVEAGDPLVVVAFGDSTTAPRRGVKQVYPVRLATLLRQTGVEATVHNAGVGGSHTGRLADNARFRRKHALDRFDDAVRAHDPDVVVVQFGWNDSWVDSNDRNGPSRIPAARYEMNLAHIVDTLARDGARVVLMTPNRPRSNVEKWRVERTEAYVAVVRKLARTRRVDLVDVWAQYGRIDARDGTSSDALLADTLHPNDRGHELVAERLAELLAPKP